VLVVDDSRAQRRLVSGPLLRWGYAVMEACSAPEALALCAEAPPDIVLSDWMMPGMDGTEFCQHFRRMERESYGYFILLTSKSGKREIAEGLDAGADDFLTKPVNNAELRARLSAGERILGMERELKDKNRLVKEKLAQIHALYEALDHDLIQARKLQQSLVRERSRRFGQSEVSLLLRPSGHVGGDLVGFFPIDAARVGLYAIDVSGHGVASALMTARLATYLSSASPEHNVALAAEPAGGHSALPPEAVAAELNRLTLTELETETYFTLLYAEIDLETGRGRMVQAGHPHPAIQRADGRVEFLGAGGMPIGLFDGARHESVSFALQPGDRLVIVSDGVTECTGPDGAMLAEEGLCTLLARNARLRGQGFLEALTWDLAEHAGGTDFADDISAILFEYGGPPG